MTSTVGHLGARVVEGGVEFGVFATSAPRVFVRLFFEDGSTETTELTAVEPGYFRGFVPGAGAGSRYKYVLGDHELPDPFARWLPDGVHNPAAILVPTYQFRHEAPTIAPHQRVIYEMHVGTFTPEGTYAAATTHLGDLAKLGVTTLELMPLSSADGSRGWGYDGVAHFAPFAPYGQPDELRSFVDEAHAAGLEVILDVVYNHFGPSGNYLGAYCPDFFRKDCGTPWGDAINYGHPIMRRYLLENALHWLQTERFDGLRLDATFMIFDESPKHILRELEETVAALSPRKVLIAEDDRNEPALVTEVGLDAIWADDFHHAVHVTLTGEQDGYYKEYKGGAAEVASTIERGWLYQGQLYGSPPRPRGHRAEALPPSAFVYALQNHDQVGNRANGERLTHIASHEAVRAVTALLLFLPMTPLIFMGEEWAASTPFLYFTDHQGDLGIAVTEGRRREFAKFASFADPVRRESIPDPQSPKTAASSTLRWDERLEDEHGAMLSLFQELLSLRKTDEVLSAPCGRHELRAVPRGEVLFCERRVGSSKRVLLVNLSHRDCEVDAELTLSGRPLWNSHGSFAVHALLAWQAVILATS